MSDQEKPVRAEPTGDSLRPWVEQTLPRAVAFARSLTRDTHVAEDVVQDCYARLLKHAERYDLVRDGWKLLLRSITHACIDVHRRGARSQVTDPQLLDGLSSTEASRDGDPVRRVEANELQGAIGEALKRLPAVQRAALELRSWGQSMAEIGEALEVSENHAAVLVHRARKAMAKLLTPFLTESVGGEPLKNCDSRS
ncbi:MAG: sigma-70 family RNA polymerase sigma factor [Pirellulaceae bacterium]|nr:sigma-70 family RNA polymerase sigma factor [Planctomycetales bacterium]